MLFHKTIIRVRYADTDQMGFVYNGKYFEYFEVGRTELMRSVGLPYNTIEQQGIQMPVRETGIQFKNAAYYDEELEIETRVPRLPDPKVHIEHTIRSVGRGVIIAEGFVDLMFIKADTKRACRPPEFFVKKVEKYYE
jgi:acyl-CoA thioester hydrolase